MFQSIRTRITYANVISTLALVMVVGGGAAWAAGKIGPGQIKANAIRTGKIQDGAVTTPKLANDAATGAKVDEGTLGKVPSAASADTATDATNAVNATNATNATNAAEATHAANADLAANSTLFTGRTLPRVRSTAFGVLNGASQGLDAATGESVLSVDVPVPTGSADLVVNASVELNSITNGVVHSASCEVRRDGTQVNAENYDITFLDAGVVNQNQVLSITTFIDDVPGSTLGDPAETIAVFCNGSIADNDVDFNNGELAVQSIPIGAAL